MKHVIHGLNWKPAFLDTYANSHANADDKKVAAGGIGGGSSNAQTARIIAA